YLAADLPLVAAMAKIQGQLTSAPSSISQKAGVAALKMDPSIVDGMVGHFRRRRDFLHAELLSIEGLVCPLPEGAFYLFPDVSAYLNSNRTSTDLCTWLMEEHHVALVPGDAFGAPDCIRISYAASDDDLREAARRLVNGFAGLS